MIGALFVHLYTLIMIDDHDHGGNNTITVTTSTVVENNTDNTNEWAWNTKGDHESSSLALTIGDRNNAVCIDKEVDNHVWKNDRATQDPQPQGLDEEKTERIAAHDEVNVNNIIDETENELKKNSLSRLCTRWKCNNNNCNCKCKYKSLKRAVLDLWKVFKKYHGIYVTIIIHLSDVFTDYLVLIQYITFAIIENNNAFYNDTDEYDLETFDHVDYLSVSIFCAITIVASKCLSGYYIYKFTKNKWDVLLNIFDLYIFREILASHRSGNKTDLLQYLQKIEKLYESTPQLTIQTYVLVNSSITSLEFDSDFIIQLLSIGLSMIAIANKLVNDDRKAFIDASGANKGLKKVNIIRIMFRISEVIANLCLGIIILSFYNVYFFSGYVFLLVYVHILLFKNGLLGKDRSNIFSYLIAVVNLGLTPCAEQKLFCNCPCVKNKNICRYSGDSCCLFKWTKALVYRINGWLIIMFYRYMFKIEWQWHCKYLHLLSYFYLLSRVIQGITILSITIIVDFVFEPNNDHFASKFVFINVSFVGYIMCYVLYVIFHDSMNLGTSIERDIKTLAINYQFADAIRLIEFDIQDRHEDKGENGWRYYNRLFQILIDENIKLLMIDKDNYDADLNEEYAKEHIFLIQEIDGIIGGLKHNDSSFLDKILQRAIEKAHQSMICLILNNNWIDNIGELKFGDGDSNILSYICKNCLHIPRLMECIIIGDDYIDGRHYINKQVLSDLLKQPTGGEFAIDKDSRFFIPEYVIDEYMILNAASQKIIPYLSENYWSLFLDCGVFLYIYNHQLFDIVEWIQVPEYIATSILCQTKKWKEDIANRIKDALKHKIDQIRITQLLILINVLSKHNNGIDMTNKLWIHDFVSKTNDYDFDFQDMVRWVLKTRNFQLFRTLVSLLHSKRYITMMTEILSDMINSRYFKTDGEKYLIHLEKLFPNMNINTNKYNAMQDTIGFEEKISQEQMEQVPKPATLRNEIENLLFKLFNDNLPILFEMVLVEWNDDEHNCYNDDQINLLKFGENNHNLLKLIADSYGHRTKTKLEEQILSNWFVVLNTILRKYKDSNTSINDKYMKSLKNIISQICDKNRTNPHESLLYKCFISPELTLKGWTQLLPHFISSYCKDKILNDQVFGWIKTLLDNQSQCKIDGRIFLNDIELGVENNFYFCVMLLAEYQNRVVYMKNMCDSLISSAIKADNAFALYFLLVLFDRHNIYYDAWLEDNIVNIDVRSLVDVIKQCKKINLIASFELKTIIHNSNVTSLIFDEYIKNHKDTNSLTKLVSEELVGKCFELDSAGYHRAKQIKQSQSVEFSYYVRFCQILSLWDVQSINDWQQYFFYDDKGNQLFNHRRKYMHNDGIFMVDVAKFVMFARNKPNLTVDVLAYSKQYQTMIKSSKNASPLLACYWFARLGLINEMNNVGTRRDHSSHIASSLICKILREFELSEKNLTIIQTLVKKLQNCGNNVQLDQKTRNWMVMCNHPLLKLFGNELEHNVDRDELKKNSYDEYNKALTKIKLTNNEYSDIEAMVVEAFNGHIKSWMQNCVHLAEKYCFKSVTISNKNIENLFINFYINYISNDHELISLRNNSNIKQLHLYVLNHFIFASKYLYNKDFQYKICLTIDSIAIKKYENVSICSNGGVLTLFHSIVKNDILFKLFEQIVTILSKNINQGDEWNGQWNEQWDEAISIGCTKDKLYLGTDSNNQLAVECMVLGQYGAKYQKCKFDNKNGTGKKYQMNDLTLAENKNKLHMVQLMHQLQKETIWSKMNQI